MRSLAEPFVIAGVVLSCAVVLGQDTGRPAGVVSFVKVCSDKVPDVSSLEAWKRSYIKDGMTDKAKALAVWRTVVAHQHQNSPPREYLHPESTVLDPIKIFNVYGYSFCSVGAAEVQALTRYLGLRARGWTISRHVVPEVYVCLVERRSPDHKLTAEHKAALVPALHTG